MFLVKTIDISSIIRCAVKICLEMYKRVGYVNYNLDSRIWQKQRKEIFLCQKSSRSKHDGDNDE